MSQTRHCSFCQETDHNIRTCDRYISDVHIQYMNTYLHHPTAGWTVHDTQLTNGHIRLLARKAGFRPIRIRTEFMAHYLEAFHRHYIELANNERQRLRDIRNAEYLQHRRRTRTLPVSVTSVGMRDAEGTAAVPVSLYYPQYNSPDQDPESRLENIPPVLHRNRNPLLYELLIRHPDVNPRDLNALFENIGLLTPPEPEELGRRKTTVQLHLDPSKFVSKSSSGDCPVCYECVDNMVLTKCDHGFCQTCMLQMIRLNCYDLSCALCRNPIKDIYVHSDESMKLAMDG